jgi:hypothetical protein
MLRIGTIYCVKLPSMAQPKEPVRANADASPLSRDAVVENYAEGIEMVVSGLAGAARARTLVDSSTGSQP